MRTRKMRTRIMRVRMMRTRTMELVSITISLFHSPLHKQQIQSWFSIDEVVFSVVADAVGVDPNVDEALHRLADDECEDVDDDDRVLEIEVPAGGSADSYENDLENLDTIDETNPAPPEFNDSKAHWNTVLGA